MSTRLRLGRQRQLVSWAAIIAGGLAILGAAAALKFPLSALFPFSNFIILAVAVFWGFRNRPTLRREGAFLVFRHPAKGVEKKKPAGSRVAKVLEWEGYEGTLFDVVWSDGEVWTIPDAFGVSLVQITASLKELGLGDVQVQKNWRVFRPEPGEK